MKRNVISVVLSAGILTGLLSACGMSQNGTTGDSATSSQAASSQQSDAQTTASSESGNSGKIQLQFWHSMSGSNGDLLNQVVSDFNASQDEIEVIPTYQGSYAEAAAKAEQATLAGNAPDIMQSAQDYVGRFAANGFFADLLPYMNQDGVDPDDFVDAFVKDAYYDDQLVMIPWGRSAQILHVNKTALDKAGCEIPTTWEELADVAKKCTIVENGKTVQYGFTMPFDHWYMFALVEQDGGQFFNDEQTGLGCVEDGTLKDSFEFLKQMQKDGSLYWQDQANDQSGAMFTSGQVAMYVSSSGATRGNEDSIGDAFEYVTAPNVKGKIAAMPTGGCGVGIVASSEQKDAAWKFLKWYIQDPEGGLAFTLGSGYLPFTKTMTQTKEIQDLWASDANFKTAYDALENGLDTYRIANLAPCLPEIQTCMQAIMNDGEDIDASIATLNESIQNVLQE